MEPAIKEGSVVLVWRWGVRYQVGEVVAVRVQSADSRAQKIFIKRIKSIEGGEYFLEGDNKKDSLDSRSFGSVRSTQVMGKIIWQL